MKKPSIAMLEFPSKSEKSEKSMDKSGELAGESEGESDSEGEAESVASEAQKELEKFSDEDLMAEIERRGLSSQLSGPALEIEVGSEGSEEQPDDGKYS